MTMGTVLIVLFFLVQTSFQPDNLSSTINTRVRYVVICIESAQYRYRRDCTGIDFFVTINARFISRVRGLSNYPNRIYIHVAHIDTASRPTMRRRHNVTMTHVRRRR